METNTNTQRVLLAVLAHPDDETFGMGGTLATYARQGAQVYLICATRGEVGEMDEKLLEGFASIAERRESELRCAAQKLGLTGVYFLDYRDSGMPGSVDNRHPSALFAAPLEEVAEKVAGYIQELKPQVVITFDPIGGYRHPDHIAIHNATVKAFFDVRSAAVQTANGGQPGYMPQKLYFHTFPRGFLRLVVRVAPIFGQNPRQWGINKDIDMVSIAEVNFPTHAEINFRPVLQIRDDATACHISQGGASLNTGVVGKLRRWFAAKEDFMRAFPEAGPGLRERDLFEGVQ